MKIFSKIYIVLLLGIFSCTEDMLEPTATETFIKFYGGTYPMEAVDAQVHPDGGIILLAVLEAEDQELNTFFIPSIIKVDEYGNKEWQVNDDSGYDIRPSSIHISGDNEFLISGILTDDFDTYTVEQNNDTTANPTQSRISFLSVQKATSAGFSNLYAHNYPYDAELNEALLPINTSGRAVLSLKNGDIITVGEEEVEESSSVKSILVELNPNLDAVLSEKTFDDNKVFINNKVFENADGNVYWAGTVQRGGNKAQLLGARPRNLSEYKDEFPKSAQSFTNNAFEMNFNEALFLGNVINGDRTDMVLIKTTIGGNLTNPIILSRNDEETNQTFSLNAKSVGLSPNGDGSILALGEATDSRLGDFYLAKIGADNEEVFSKLYGGTNRDVPVKVLSANRGIVMFGHSNFADAGTLVLIKTDENGEF